MTRGDEQDKKGRKFVYPDSFIKLSSHMRAYFHLPYRQTEGVVRAHAANTLSSIPDYSRICRRINKLNITLLLFNVLIHFLI